MALWQKIRRMSGNKQLANNLLDETQSEVERMQPVNIIVAGKTGSGKSTLINALFRENLTETGVGQPVTQHIQKITKAGVPLTLYDTKGLELSVEAQHEVLQSLADLLKEAKAKGPHEEIDVVYYCINNLANRIEAFEVELIEALAKEVPVILVLTQSLSQEPSELEVYIRSLDLPLAEVVPVLTKDYAIQAEQIIEAHGLQSLVDLTLAVIPESSQQAFVNAQRIDLNRKVQDARRWAKRYITTSFGVGFMPIPMSDAAILVPMQITMLAHITSIFGLSLDKAQIVSMFAGIGGTGGVTLLGKTIVSSAFKWVPGLGTVTGGVISGTTASTLTIALAYSYIEILKQITLAESQGRDLPLKEIQRLMNQNLAEHLANAQQFIPQEVKDQLPAWLKGFLDEEN